jgi:hypothetical protein
MKAVRILAVLALVAGVADVAFAQTANQNVTIQVDAINVISVAGSPSLVITTATAGSPPQTVSNSASSWNVTTNQSGAKITASINSAMPAGLTLSASLSAPAGATSAGLTALSTTAADVVTGITKVAQAALGLTYQLDATVAAGVVASTTRTVTYTITGGT